MSSVAYRFINNCNNSAYVKEQYFIILWITVITSVLFIEMEIFFTRLKTLVRPVMDVLFHLVCYRKLSQRTFKTFREINVHFHLARFEAAIWTIWVKVQKSQFGRLSSTVPWISDNSLKYTLNSKLYLFYRRYIYASHGHWSQLKQFNYIIALSATFLIKKSFMTNSTI